MINKHFFKILAGFVGMLALGLVGVAIVNHVDKPNIQSAASNSPGR